jgi:hypothetical protein
MAHEPEVFRSPGIRLVCGFRRCQIIAHRRRGEERMRHARQHGKLIAACGTATGRHHRRGVPAQHRRRLADRRNAGETGNQPVIGSHSVSTFLAQRTKITTRATARPYQVIAYDKWLFGGLGKCRTGSG